MLATRWKKLQRDRQAMGGRIAMIAAALAAGMFAVAAIASAYAVLTRELSRNYLSTNPASMLIAITDKAPELARMLRMDPEVVNAEAASIVEARTELKNGEWGRLLLFVVPDFSSLCIGKVFPESGAYPPSPGTVLVERGTLAYLGATLGSELNIELANGRRAHAVISGTVHDPALAPSWQEQTAYVYLTPETLAGLGGDPALDLVKVLVKDAVHDQAKVDEVAIRLGQDLAAKRVAIHQIQTPPAGRHPHQSQMDAVLGMFIAFALFAFVLSSILAAVTADALLSQQVRQIAMMKAVGARFSQVAGLYLAGVLVVSAVGVAVGLPLGLLAGRGLSSVVASLLNFTIESNGVPAWLLLLLAGAGILTPCLFALWPVSRAAGRTVRESLADYGVSRKDFGDTRFDSVLAGIKGLDRSLALALRNAFRRRGRMALTLSLLGVSGAMFISSLSVNKAWQAYIDASAADRNYDLEYRLDHPVPADTLVAALAAVPGVARAEPVGRATAARARPDGLTIVRTYPDGGHANLDLRSLPRPDSLGPLVFLEGRPYGQEETDVVLINQNARRLLGGPNAGDRIEISVDGRAARFRVSGVVRQIITPPAIYAPQSAFAAVTGTEGKTNAVRIVTISHSPESVAAVAAAVESRLRDLGLGIAFSATEAQIGAAVAGHVKILMVSLVVLAFVIATVGLLGLASSLGSGVVERTREFGVMRAIGATGSVVIRNVVAEGVFTGLASIAVATVLAWPLAYAIGGLVGTLSFGLPLPPTLSWAALSAWTLLIALGAAAASLVPARSAARLTVRQTLSYS